MDLSRTSDPSEVDPWQLRSPSTASPDLSGSILNAKDNPKRGSRRCGLLQCRKPECYLTSHRQFVVVRRHASRLKALSLGPGSLKSWCHQPSNGILDHLMLRIEKQMADEPNAVPLTNENLVVFRQAAHHYFSCQIDRLIQTYSPHLDPAEYKSTMKDLALSSTVFCVCITANAQIDMLLRRCIRTPDRSSEVIYATTAHILRHKLKSFRTMDVDWLLVLVIALIGFDVAFERMDCLPRHCEALKQLVAVKGGIHTIGHTLPYVLNTDRIMAVLMGKYPMYRHSPILPAAAPFCPSINPYGYAFQSPEAITAIDLRIHRFCLAQCKLMNLMDFYQISLVPKTPPVTDPSILPYYRYERDRLHCDGTRLYADCHENQALGKTPDSNDTDERLGDTHDLVLSKTRCVLLAALIIEHEVSHGNYNPLKGRFLASQLQSVLQRQPETEWIGYNDMRIWILFTLAAVPQKWCDHPWAVKQLMHQLAFKSDRDWSLDGWRDNLLMVLREHIWSESLYPAFVRVCTEMTDKREF